MGAYALIQGAQHSRDPYAVPQSEYVGIVEAVPFFWKEYNPGRLPRLKSSATSLVVKNDKAHARWVLSLGSV